MYIICSTTIYYIHIYTTTIYIYTIRISLSLSLYVYIYIYIYIVAELLPAGPRLRGAGRRGLGAPPAHKCIYLL